MSSTLLRQTLILLSGIAVPVACSSCAAFQAHGLRPLYQGRFSDGCTVELSEYFERDALRGDPQHNFVALVATVTTPEQPAVSYELARQGGSATTGPEAGYQFGRLEARTDASGQRLWFIDTSVACTIASLDLINVTATGPQDWPPPWARCDSGEPVAPATP